MRLIELRLQGYGRFTAANLYSDGKLTALVGPNEAGKTTLLDALMELNTDGWQKPYMVAPQGNEPILEARFALNYSELSDVTHYSARPAALILTKDARGKRTTTFLGCLAHEPSWQQSLKKKLDAVLFGTHSELGKSHLHNTVESEKFMKLLLSGHLNHPDLLRNAWSTFKNTMGPHLRTEMAQEEVDRYTSIRAGALKDEEKLMNTLHVPQFVLYSSEARRIPARIALGETGAAAIAPLLQVGQTSTRELGDALQRDINQLNNILRRAARRVTDQLLRRWGQNQLELQWHAETNGTLVTTVLNSDTQEGQPIDRRSEGFRQFLALSAALHPLQSQHSAILLIDEVEQHLHFQAQAELIRFLDGQGMAQQVIYSTHSPGALPEDLNNVRAIEPQANGTSRIANRPWQQGSRQVEHLFRLLGAGSFLFAALRSAVVTEGPTDAMLYPILFREALDRGERPLGWQFLPGYSQHRKPEGYNDQGVHVAFLFDGDAEGQAMAIELTERTDAARMPSNKVVRLEEGLVLEDYLAPQALLDAVNELTASSNPTQILTAEDCPAHGRWAWLTSWTRAHAPGVQLDKKRLAAALLDLHRTGRPLLDPTRKAALRDRGQQLEQALQLGTA